MIPMQRSLSSPVAVHSDSPQTSAPATARPRSPTPPPEQHVHTPRHRRINSGSPARSTDTTISLPVRQSHDTLRRGSAHRRTNSGASRKAIIAQVTSAVSGPTPKDSSDSVDSIDAVTVTRPKLRRPLLADTSLYVTPVERDQEIDRTTLEELAHLVRLSKYQERKRANTRIRLQRSLISTALSARLARCGDMAHRNLVDLFRGEDKKVFASLYNAVLDVRKSCEEMRRFSLLEPDMDLSLQSLGLGSSGLATPTSVMSGKSLVAVGTMTPFFNDISAQARETFLNFLTQVRTNPDYVATRIASLDSSELAAITSFHHGLEPIESVLPYHSRTPGRGAGTTSGRNAPQDRTAIERLLSFQRHDPLSALVYTCFANSAGPDSAEDKKRTAVWATTCARLISTQKSGFEAILISVLNAWTAMRDWSGKSNMEWYLMKILEDGAFLLDRAEDQQGTRFNLSEWTTKDQIAADEFYDRATDELFDVIDDEDGTGIPEGLVELGNEILKRLDPKYVDSTRRWFIYKWLFSVWLLGVVIYPESYGLMAEYHITEYGRQKILKQVALRAQHIVVEMTCYKTPVATPPKIKDHIENILGRFKDPKGRRTKPRLLPARSITSLRETAEVHPYLVISPADLVTLVNALFPEKRPMSARSHSGRSGGAPSVSGFSVLSAPMSTATFDTASVVSDVESVISEATTWRGPLDEQHTGSSHGHSPGFQDFNNHEPMSDYEDDGYRLRLAMHEMAQILGQEAVLGSCHPCAERWAVLFISADGQSLSTSMTYDPDDDPDEEENSSTSDTDDDSTESDRPDLNKDYHQLRDSILKLVEDYEIPQRQEHGSSTAKTFSNRAHGRKKYHVKNKVVTPASTMGSRNPYRQRTESVVSSIAESPTVNQKGKESEAVEEDSDPPSVLVDMLKAASAQSRAQSDFVSAHLYWRTLQQLNALSSESLRQNDFATLLSIFSRGPRDLINRSNAAIEEYEAWLVWLKQSQERAEGLIDSMMRRFRALRDKMWYVTDVRNSGPYMDSRNIAVALKTMGMPRKWRNFQQTHRYMQRSGAASFLFRTESQALELLAASEDQGGPNKLSDEQADTTARWLQHGDIQNFCRGEERIHRFTLEIDLCINKLVGPNIVDTPVLWSSDLFVTDRRTMEGSSKGTRHRDNSGHTWEDSVSVSSDSERRYGSLGRASGKSVNLRNLSAHNFSQASFDSGRHSFSRASTALSDSQEYFGMSSPVHAIDSSSTFWSPFQTTMSTSQMSRAQSPNSSVTNLSSVFSHPQQPSHMSPGRPGTSASSNETVYQQRISDDKTRFLAELRQTLTSLLLSDLGNLVFARGSETDVWFDGLGQECIDRRETTRRRALKETRRSSRANPSQRVVERRRSFGNLRGTGGSDSGERAASDTQSQGLGSDIAGSHGNDSSTTSDTLRLNQQSAKKDTTPDFPFTKAYQRLLRMFCVHPNPHAKLNALYELEHLIVASLNSGSKRSRLAWARSEGSASSATGDHSVAGRSKPLEDAIDNVRERRSHAMANHPTFPTPGYAGRPSGGVRDAETRSIMTVNNSNTDVISNILQALFRDASIRPKTLFRDLQFIAALVPATTLDQERAKAFWDTSLAALLLKQEVCRTMVEVADDVVKLYTSTRSSASLLATQHANSTHPTSSSTSTTDSTDPALTSSSGVHGDASTTITVPSSAASSPGLPSPLPLTTYSLADAGRMWAIAAKEGDPSAQRELGLFYLGYPELVERAALPLSKPREVFKQAVMEKYGGSRSGFGPHSGLGLSLGGGSGSRGRDAPPGGDVRSDPALMCVAIHWMKEAAERGNDELARQFLCQDGIVGL